MRKIAFAVVELIETLSGAQRTVFAFPFCLLLNCTVRENEKFAEASDDADTRDRGMLAFG